MLAVKRVVDFHAHFPVGWKPRNTEEKLREYALERRRKMRSEWGFPEPDWDIEPDRLAELWKEEAGRYGLYRVVFVTGGGNDALARIVSRYPGLFLGFAHHDLEADGAADELRRAVDELGLRGYKIIGPWVDRPLDDDSLRPVWEFCEERELPVLIHFGFLGHGGLAASHPNMNPLSLSPVALRYPRIPFIVPHFGCGYVRELLQLCWSCPNVYVDTSGSNQWTRWMPYPLDLKDLFRKMYETVGSGRIIFGTDSSWFPRGFVKRYFDEQLLACRELGFKEEDIDAIFWGNAARLLGLAGTASAGEGRGSRAAGRDR